MHVEGIPHQRNFLKDYLFYKNIEVEGSLWMFLTELPALKPKNVLKFLQEKHAPSFIVSFT